MALTYEEDEDLAAFLTDVAKDREERGLGNEDDEAEPSFRKPARTRKKAAVPQPTTEDDHTFAEDPDPWADEPKQNLADKVFPDDPFKAAKKVTQAVRKDVKGKVAMFLTIAGATWAGRDQHCGTALLEAVPDQADEEGGTSAGIATALTDIICDSPDVVKWFTSSGKYMKWLTLAMAVQPVVQTAFHHHITHAITDEPVEQGWSQYTVG